MTRVEETVSRASTANCERAFAGSLLCGDARAMDSGLRASEFTDPLCRRIFAVALALEERGQTCDLATLADAAPDVDLAAAIELAQEAAPMAALAAQHADSIRTAAQRRALIAEGMALAQDAQDPERSVRELADGARAHLDKIAGELPSSGTLGGVDALCNFYTQLTGGPIEPVVRFGFAKIDEALCIAGPKLVVIGARPSVGKSALLLHLAINAICAGKRVLLVSLEMDADELLGRMVARLSGVSSSDIGARKLTDAQLLSVTEGMASLPGDRFAVCTAARTVRDVRREALRMRANGGLDLVAVDYLQLLDAGRKTSNRVEAVGDITRSMKLLACELGVPILTASQLNRASERNDAPHLSDLRESGSIEQDADAVLLLHAPNGKEQKARELAIAKNRQGRCGGIQLLFDGARMLFAQEYKE